MTDSRQYELPLGELVERITIAQLRELLLNSDKYEDEIKRLEHDIDLVMKQKAVVINARIIRIIFLTAQLNTLIWVYKDKMLENEANYAHYLKLSHQLNGLRNTLKNKLMLEIDNIESSALRTNTNTDKLEFHVSL
jgi:hypothetical protein